MFPGTGGGCLVPACYRRVALACGRRVGGGVVRPVAPRPSLVPRPPTRGPTHLQSRSKCNGRINWSLLVILVGQGRQLQALERLKEVTLCLLRIIVRQCEVHTAQKFRRGLQLYTVYSRMWGEEAARTMLANFRRILLSRGRHMLLSAVCFTNFNWSKEKISNESLQRAVNDLDSVENLCKATVECEMCGKRQVIDQQMANVDYCTCTGSLGYTDRCRVYDSWEPFIEREDHIVWRQRHRVHKHLYAYKVYGTYDDVSLGAFMEVHLNTKFRSEWDDTALQLRVLDSDQDSNSDLIYWLVKFPHFFANRDYIYKRRFSVNQEKKEVVIMSEAISPDYIPEETGIHRVNEYWSTMVIRAHEDIHKPGIEYTLTYFDNPGTSLPQSLTNFIAASGFPNFLRKIHRVALSLQAIHEKGEDVYVSLPKELRYPTTEIAGQIDEEPAEPTFPESKDREVSVAGTLDAGAQFEANDDAPECKLAEAQKSSLVRKVSDVMSVLDLNKAEESSVNPTSEKYGEKCLPGTREVCDSEHSEIPSEELAGMTPVTRTDHKHESVPILHNQAAESDISAIRDGAVSVRDGCRDNPNTSSSDRVLHVQVGGKHVAVDLLEGMEVVAPDLESKTLLLRKIEKMNEDLYYNFEKKVPVIAKLVYKMKSFQEHALKKKERSIRKMEELSQKGHYDHCGTDEKTLKYLEVLFQAMRDVLQANKDIRTGKSLMKVHEDIHEKVTNKENSSADASSDSSSTASQHPDNSRHSESHTTNSTSPTSDQNIQLSTDERKQKPSKTTENLKPPDGPPPACASRVQQFPACTESSSGERAYSNAEYCEARENTPEDMTWWASWMYVPSISGWWGTSNVQSSCESEDLGNSGDHGTINPHDNSSSESFMSQAWYVIGLGWLFHSDTKLNAGDTDNQGGKLHMQADESCVSKHDCDNDCAGSSTWYWYPVTSASRVYAWVFSTSKANA
nr:uncharacterized protein LOC123760879 [Procambarus clarkii]